MEPSRWCAPLLLMLCLVCPAAIAAPAAESLWHRLGGDPVMTRVAASTLTQVSRDPALNRSFDGVDLPKLTAKLVEHLCSVTGGGCVYTGDSMKTAHGGLDIRQREFYGMVEALRVALDANGVAEGEKNELLRVLAPMKRDVVSK